VTDVVEDTDRLWSAARAGDEDALLQLTEAVGRIAGAYLRRRGVPPGELDDLVQETQASTLRFLGDHAEAPQRLFGFLKARARGVFTEYVRKKRRTGELSDLGLPLLPADDERPEEELQAEELLAALRDCRARLDAKYAEVVRLRYDLELPTPEVAERLGLSTAGVNTRAFRAHRELAACLQRKGVRI
jgi:RNA polymerase sigma factor (sigma-70 family)